MITKYDIATNVTFAGIDGKLSEGRYAKMSADDQRAIFGANVFGRASLRISADGQGRVEVYKTACFGLDYHHGEYSFERVAEAVNAGQKLNPAA